MFKVAHFVLLPGGGTLSAIDVENVIKKSIKNSTSVEATKLATETTESVSFPEILRLHLEKRRRGKNKTLGDAINPVRVLSIWPSHRADLQASPLVSG